MGFDVFQGLDITPTIIKSFPNDGDKVLLLDADYITYTVTYSNGEEKKLDNELSLKLKCEHAGNIIMDAMHKARADGVLLFFTDSGTNFRLDYLPDYKTHRVQEKPLHWQEVRDFLTTQYADNIVHSVNNEADDMVSITMKLATMELELEGVPRTPQAYKDFCKFIIGSPDKDLNQVFGWHVNLKSGEHYFVDDLGTLTPVWKEGTKNGKMTKRLTKLEGTGAKFFWAQLIMGDPVDGFKGIPRKGGAAAYELLNNCRSEVECKEVVVQAYKDYFGDKWYDELLVQGRMAYLQQTIGEVWGDTLKQYIGDSI